MWVSVYLTFRGRAVLARPQGDRNQENPAGFMFLTVREHDSVGRVGAVLASGRGSTRPSRWFALLARRAVAATPTAQGPRVASVLFAEFCSALARTALLGYICKSPFLDQVVGGAGGGGALSVSLQAVTVHPV